MDAAPRPKAPRDDSTDPLWHERSWMTDAHAESNPPSGRELAELLRRQLALYQQLRTLSDEQRRALEEGSTQDLLGVLARRQHVVDELGEVVGALAGAGSRWDEITAELDTAEREALQGVVDEVQRLAEEVMKRDEDDQSQLRGMRQGVSGEIKAMNAGRAAASAYRGGMRSAYGSPAAGSPARFADRSA